MKKYRLRVGLDVDDTLYECNGYALSIINKNHPDEEPVSINEIKGWGNYGRHFEERIALYSDPEFVRTQPILPGAQKFVRDLSKYADVFFVTAVPVMCMSARAERLVKDFPEIPSQNIIIGTRKDVFALDMLLDDGAHNISSSKAIYPVLFRKPWNMDMTGLLAVNSYSDFMQLFKMVRNSFTEKAPDLSDGGVICLVGPSGSLKNEIAHEMTQFSSDFEKPLTSTTRPRHDGEAEDAYRFIDEEQFIREKDDGKFLETTVYSRYHFGTAKNQVDPIVNNGGYAVIPIDICGALTIRNAYRTQTLLVFVNREKSEVIKNIIGRKSSDDDKVRRIMSLDFEYRNNDICDVELQVDNDAKKAAETLIDIVRNKLSR
ncbi:MAG: hypothetical protein MJ124_06820 [Lachnospiraceae bacterium]|nr:hypothetical protein [Lachnospiraceae bacterium]